jgi:hypothetical protein
MERIRHLSKNDFIIILLAVFISWPCCNGFRIDLEKKACHATEQASFVAAWHVMGIARGQDAPGSTPQLLKTPLVVFDFEHFFKFHSANGFHCIATCFANESSSIVSRPILFLQLLI